IRRLQAAYDRLTVVIAERTGYARRQPRLLRRVKRIKQLQLEAPVHASDHVVHHRHADFVRRLRILPREVVIDEPGKGFGDSLGFAPLLDCHFPQLLHLDHVELGRPFVERPQVSVDADLRYLWALYERTPKLDMIKVQELRKVTVKKRGKTKTVTKTFTRLVDNDFTWKDPKAADKVGMTMMDYVIGGMDRSFKLKLFYTLYAAEQAGLSPGITSASRAHYRQSIISGLKAANDMSYH